MLKTVTHSLSDHEISFTVRAKINHFGMESFKPYMYKSFEHY